MKKLITFISLCLAIVMTLPLVASCAADTGDLPFTDVKAGKWYYDNVKYVYENGIMNGVTGTKFDPNGTLTRGMCATIIYRMAGSPKTEAENKFTDVKAGKYYTKAVTWAQSKGIVNGRTETAFDPDGDIKRAEFATMLYRYLNVKLLVLPIIKDDSPADDDLIPSYATEAVDSLFRAGVVNGREDGRFDPKAKITRAETAAMIDRFIKTAEERSITGDDDVLTIAFFGDSFIYVPKVPEQFKAIAGDKYRVEIKNLARPGWTLYDHYQKWIQRSKSTIAYLTKDWDIVVLDETGAASNLGLKEELVDIYNILDFDNLPELKSDSFDEFYEKCIENGMIVSSVFYEYLVELLGQDKLYYNLCISNIMKKEGGSVIRVKEFSEDGLSRLVTIGDNPKTMEMHWENTNKAEFKWRDWLRDNCDVNRIMLNLDSFDPDHPLDSTDFDHMPDDYHPNLMYGYCHALALYCSLTGEPCAEQNNGILTDDDIPGDTPEEKEAYMVMIKNLVQEQLDFQNSH